MPQAVRSLRRAGREYAQGPVQRAVFDPALRGQAGIRMGGGEALQHHHRGHFSSKSVGTGIRDPLRTAPADSEKEGVRNRSQSQTEVRKKSGTCLFQKRIVQPPRFGCQRKKACCRLTASFFSLCIGSQQGRSIQRTMQLYWRSMDGMSRSSVRWYLARMERSDCVDRGRADG